MQQTETGLIRETHDEILLLLGYSRLRSEHSRDVQLLLAIGGLSLLLQWFWRRPIIRLVALDTDDIAGLVRCAGKSMLILIVWAHTWTYPLPCAVLQAFGTRNEPR